MLSLMCEVFYPIILSLSEREHDKPMFLLFLLFVLEFYKL